MAKNQFNYSYSECIAQSAKIGWTPPPAASVGFSQSRHGVRWTETEAIHARDMFEAGHSLRNIAIVHGRDIGGIYAKLRSKGWYDDNKDGTTKAHTFLNPDLYTYSFMEYGLIRDETPQRSGDQAMNEPKYPAQPAVHPAALDNSKPLVEVVTMVKGQDVRSLNPQQLIDIIRKLESEKAGLVLLNVESKYIKARIEQLTNDTKTVIDVLDTMHTTAE